MGAVSEAVSGPLRKTVNIPGLISDYYRRLGGDTRVIRQIRPR